MLAHELGHFATARAFKITVDEFGIGFPPFRGGPFRRLDTLGAAAVVRDLEALDARFPGRFTPAARLRALADSGGRFHP